MRLSRFIFANMEEIVQEWESFARTLAPAADQMSASELRDHAQQILDSIARDIDTGHNCDLSRCNQTCPSTAATDAESAAATHGTLRQISGFTMPQLIAEFRALRATVLRLWLPTLTRIDEGTSKEMLRFNELIDQALAESANTFSAQTERARDTFLAVLGHDLRGPLATMTSVGDLLLQPNGDADRLRHAGARVRRSAAMMTVMVNDLLEYARTQLGASIPIAPHEANMKTICSAALEDAQAAYPECPFQVHVPDELWGEFDSIRLQQVITNLLNNAAQYRSKESPVELVARNESGEVVIEVRNRGPLIPKESLQVIFNPLVQLPLDGAEQNRSSGNLGLGLFIACQITMAHGGTLTATSTPSEGTVFTLKLPRERQN